MDQVSKVECAIQRSNFDPRMYLLTLSVGEEFVSQAGGEAGYGYPQARAVVDDFGTLVIVRGWK